VTEHNHVSFKKGDIVYNPTELGVEWTVVAYQPQHNAWLAVRGRIEINRRSSKFWDCASIMSEQDLVEAMEAIGLKTTRIINPTGWIKETVQ